MILSVCRMAEAPGLSLFWNQAHRQDPLTRKMGIASIPFVCCFTNRFQLRWFRNTWPLEPGKVATWITRNIFGFFFKPLPYSLLEKFLFSDHVYALLMCWFLSTSIQNVSKKAFYLLLRSPPIVTPTSSGIRHSPTEVQLAAAYVACTSALLRSVISPWRYFQILPCPDTLATVCAMALSRSLWFHWAYHSCISQTFEALAYGFPGSTETILHARWRIMWFSDFAGMCQGRGAKRSWSFLPLSAQPRLGLRYFMFAPQLICCMCRKTPGNYLSFQSSDQVHASSSLHFAIVGGH